jgi:hypothetical protein
MLNVRQRMMRIGILAVVAMAAFPAMASAAKCDKVPTTKVFAAIGDNSDYFLAQGGDFEGKLEWKAVGPVVQTYTHPAFPAAGSTGLVLGAGGSVTSPNLCADLDRPTLRFFAYAPQHTGTLRVDAIGDHGEVQTLGRLNGAALSLNSGLLSFGNVLGLNLDDSKHVQLRLTAESGVWVTDAVYIDPYMK